MTSIPLKALLPGRRPEPGELRVGDLRICEVRALKTQAGSTALNKAGRLILHGRADGRRVKIYELDSAEHAQFVAHVSAVRPAGLRLPKVMAVQGRFIVCDWVDGKALSEQRLTRDLLARLALLQARIHSADIAGLPQSGFDYWADVIAPRFLRAAELVGKAQVAQRTVAMVDDWRTGAPRTLNHPDLTLPNILLTDGGEVPIDNELLYVGAGGFMDVLNAANSLPAIFRQDYVDAYLKAPGAHELPSRPVLQAFWLARRAGAHFVAGKVKALAALMADPGKAADLAWIG